MGIAFSGNILAAIMKGIKKGVEESKKFSWDETMKKIDSYYRNIADYEV